LSIGNLSARMGFYPSMLVADPDSANSLAAVIEPRAAYTEAVRTLRTSLLRGSGGFAAQRHLDHEFRARRRLKACSALIWQSCLLSKARKFCWSMAICELQVCTAHLTLRPDKGLSSLLSTDKIHANLLSTAVPMNAMPGLDVMAAGPVPQYPAELLASEQMAEVMLVWRKEYDFIIVDGAPVLPVTDLFLLSTLADLTLVVLVIK